MAATTGTTQRAHLRRTPEAIAVLEPQRERDLASLTLSGYFLARADRRNEALAVLATLLERWRRRHEGAAHVAMVHAGFGEMDQAFTWLDRGFDDGSLVLNPWFGMVMEPAFTDLRRDARFGAVRRQLGLPVPDGPEG